MHLGVSLPESASGQLLADDLRGRRGRAVPQLVASHVPRAPHIADHARRPPPRPLRLHGAPRCWLPPVRSSGAPEPLMAYPRFPGPLRMRLAGLGVTRMWALTLRSSRRPVSRGSV